MVEPQNWCKTGAKNASQAARTSLVARENNAFGTTFEKLSARGALHGRAAKLAPKSASQAAKMAPKSASQAARISLIALYVDDFL